MTALRIDGIDISHHQAQTIDYAAAKRAGVKWIYHKATEGSTVTDENYARRRTEAKAAGIPFGAYHFARPEGGDAVAEARAFLKAATPKPGDLAPCLDLEVAPTGVDLRAWAAAFVREVERAVGVKPVMYTPYDLGDAVKGCIIWRPRYNNTNMPPQFRWDIWQFSNGVLGNPHTVPGVGACDINHMRDGLEVADFTIPRKAADVPDPLARPLWRGRTNVDAITIAAIEAAEEIGGHEFVVTQGSYQGGSGDPLSAGTHDLGGVIDLRWCGHNSCILALRKVGFFAWHRTPAQGPWPDHVHAGLLGHPHMALAAIRQGDAYRAGRNGLDNNGPDDGPRINPIPMFTWPPEDPMADYAAQLDRIEKKLDVSNANQRERDKALKVLLKEKFKATDDDLDAIFAKVNES